MNKPIYLSCPLPSPLHTLAYLRRTVTPSSIHLVGTATLSESLHDTSSEKYQKKALLYPADLNHPTKPRRSSASILLQAVEEPADEDEESGMSSFLQYCATCERQIITPGSTILYCSEACRKKDISRPPSIPSLHAISPFTESPYSPFDLPSGDIMPQRSPTVLRPLSIASSASDFDLSSLAAADYSPLTSSPWRRESDDPALRYLDQFSSDLALRRRRSRTRESSSGLPSLVHSPSSSYGTVASSSTASSQHHHGHVHHHPAPPTTTTMNKRDMYSTSHHTSKSIDLVMPYNISCSSTTTTTSAATGNGPMSPTQLLKDASLKSSASTLTSFRTVEASDMSYDKRKDRKSAIGVQDFATVVDDNEGWAGRSFRRRRSQRV
ncbi:unnamed protein product [Zymoseptoria tritici ST99CH_3D7]|uniref:Life-span regulatory factor domain-containing protein n=1 Tax=Zymoseptoria tritici (strain ST99CH_3D7) TaxID=1276538 RepID=A0A1X7RQ90_ZYMT9|nr:unnamed protein product [Zymoseptoria tritici ST99CH_3D7]